jgi:G3E family GTPase
MNKIPVNIITGFLGAGKTTAIINLLRQKTSDEQWAIIINEFGKISIDSQTLQSSSVAGNVYDISGGCICCSAKGYFHENLTEIINTGNYSRIIIEPSGLGGVDMVSEIVESNNQLILMPKICLVDIQLMKNERIQRLPIYRNQITKSEIIIFSKSDLVNNKQEEQDLIDKFNEFYPNKNILEYELMSMLLNCYVQQESAKHNYRLLSSEKNNLEDSNYQKKMLNFDTTFVFDAHKLAKILCKYPEILRAKGHIITENNNWVLINYTLSNCHFEQCDSKEHNEIVIITEMADEDFFQRLEVEIKLATLSNIN